MTNFDGGLEYFELTAVMKALMHEAGQTGLPVRLKVASTNDPSMRLYLRLGFVPIQYDVLYVEMEWPAPAMAAPQPPD
jgi:RimJ/RimL family protein N-acetyltransferase